MFDYFNGFWSWAKKNKTKLSPNVLALYYYFLYLANDNEWAEQFDIYSQYAMNYTGMKSYKTYKKALDELEELGLIKFYRRSGNQFMCNSIGLVKLKNVGVVKNTKPLTKSPTKSHADSSPNHMPNQVQSNDQITSHIIIDNIDSKDYEDSKDLKIKKTKKKKPELIPFIESIYNDNFEQFDIDFSKTKTAIENPMIDKKKLFDTLQFSEPAKHRYSNWISAAQNWYKNYPSKYAFSLTSILEKDPAYAMMTKGQQVIAQNNLKMEMQKQFIKPNQDDDLPF